MSSKTSIEWTDATWNPVRGCSRVSAGCDNCYAIKEAGRHAGEHTTVRDVPGPYFGFVAPRASGKMDWTGKVALVEKHLLDPLRWKKPRRVFVNSMSDLFHEALPDEAIDRVFAVMTCAQRHTFQILTKRPERMLAYLSRDRGPVNVLARILNAARAMPKPKGWVAPESHGWPYRNVWLGVSVENQATWNERVPILQDTPSAVRFISYEPALAAVKMLHVDLFGVHLVIVGGESGPHARPFDVAWARETIAQCKAAGVACFVKQLGGNPQAQEGRDFEWEKVPEALGGGRAREGIGSAQLSPNGCLYLRDRKGGDWGEWPADLRVREFPERRPTP